MGAKPAMLAGLLTLGLLACGPRLTSPPLTIVDQVAMKSGDDPSWSNPDLDDSDWQVVAFEDVPQVASIVWMRATVALQPADPEDHPLAIYFAALAAHEIWWDGERIGGGGSVGATAEQERPGPIQDWHEIPDRLATPGYHRIAIRTSAFHRHFHPRTGYWAVLVGPYRQLHAIGEVYTGVALVSLSGIVMMAFFALMMFAQDRRERSFLFLGLLCLTAAALLIAESWKNVFGYTYNWHLLRLVIVTALAWLLDLFLLVFLVRRFPMTGARWFLAAGIAGASAALFIFASWDLKAIIGLLWGFFLASFWSLRAVVKRLPGSLLAAAGVCSCFGTLVMAPDVILDRNLYIALIFLLLCLLGSHVLQVRKVRMEREAALLKSTRLELELIRKHIQPHFLLNTLNALSEWIDQEPRVAAGMIQSLAEEFRVLSDISSRSLIRMDEEIRLCRTHLEIMSRRKGREYRMTTTGVDPAAPIPPAVIHTLVENAITHGRHGGRTVEFRLAEERLDGRRRYVFSSPDAASPGDTVAEGTGLRYIRARLRESFGERWSLVSRADGTQWRTEILVPETI
jgi:hypothetical protein